MIMLTDLLSKIPIKKLNFYILSVFVQRFIIVLGAFFALLMMFSVIQIKGRLEVEVNTLTFIYFAFTRTMVALEFIFPNVFFIALLWSVIKISSNNQLIALKSAGLSFVDLRKCFFVISLGVVSFYLFIMNGPMVKFYNDAESMRRDLYGTVQSDIEYSIVEKNVALKTKYIVHFFIDKIPKKEGKILLHHLTSVVYVEDTLESLCLFEFAEIIPQDVGIKIVPLGKGRQKCNYMSTTEMSEKNLQNIELVETSRDNVIEMISEYTKKYSYYSFIEMPKIMYRAYSNRLDAVAIELSFYGHVQNAILIIIIFFVTTYIMRHQGGRMENKALVVIKLSVIMILLFLFNMILLGVAPKIFSGSLVPVLLTAVPLLNLIFVIYITCL